MYIMIIPNVWETSQKHCNVLHSFYFFNHSQTVISLFIRYTVLVIDKSQSGLIDNSGHIWYIKQ